MSHIYVEPSPRANPQGEAHLPWRVMLMENGKARHTNDAGDYPTACMKATSAATRRGVSFIGETGGTSTKVEPEESEVVHESQTGDYLNARRPRGAPDLGARVVEHHFCGDDYEGVVSYYLSEQFVIVTDDGQERIVHMQDCWNLKG